MLTREAIGQLFVFGFEGTTLSAGLRELLREFHLGGVILFRPNVESVEQVWALTGQFRNTEPSPPPAVFVDEEGGPVSRLPAPVLRLPPMRRLGALEDHGLVLEVGYSLGRELSALGVHVNLAPVVDVDTNPANPVIGERAFHADPEQVARLGVAMMQGLHAGGVTACLKHFPGHGDTDTDSHHALPVLNHDRARLEAVELVPFRAGIRAGARMLMTAHVLLPGEDPVHPATLSPIFLGSALRRALGYEGLVLSDDLQMKAVSDRYSAMEILSLGIAGGIDLFVLRGDEDNQRRFLEAAVRLAEIDPGARARMWERSRRVLAWKRAHVKRDRRATSCADLAGAFDNPRRRALDIQLTAALGDRTS